MIKLATLTLAALSLSGCVWFAALPLAMQITIAGGSATAIGLSVNALHDCKVDGGCKDVALPP